MGLHIYFVRHGETQWNSENRIQGLLDSPLTSTGKIQLFNLSRELSKIHFTAGYVSDLQRAVDSASILSRLIPPIEWISDMRLRERDYGIFQGLTWSDILQTYPKEGDLERKGDFYNAVPKGESKSDILIRSQQFLNFLALRHSKGNVIVVTHGGVLNVLIRDILGIPQEITRKFHIPNAGLFIVENSHHGWMVKSMGNHCLPHDCQ